MVERVDVLTSGASAVYGSDAVAGVVNFITKRDFQGFEIDYQYGWNEIQTQTDLCQMFSRVMALITQVGSLPAKLGCFPL